MLEEKEFSFHLGLALVKNYVEVNKAEILVESVKDKGSTFTVVFNRKSAETAETKTPESKPEDVSQLS